YIFFFFQAEDGIRDSSVTGVQTCALPISFREPRDLTSRVSGPRETTAECLATPSFRPKDDRAHAAAWVRELIGAATPQEAASEWSGRASKRPPIRAGRWFCDSCPASKKPATVREKEGASQRRSQPRARGARPREKGSSPH